MSQPDINVSEHGDDLQEVEGKTSLNVLKRVNSANNLAIPGSTVQQSQTRSLPPSPQRSPSRKQSLVNENPFTLCAVALEDIHKQPETANECAVRLLDHILTCASDECLMDAAKENGRHLYANMNQDEKVDKINMMVRCMASFKLYFKIKSGL